jgi:CP family cyanate transporter-like MFS transporter
VILIALNLRPFLTAIGPWPSHRREAGPRGGYPGLGHPAAPLAYRGRRAAHPGAPGSHGPAPPARDGPAAARPWQRPAPRSGERRPAHRQRRPVRAGLGPGAGCCPASSRRGSPKGAPGDGDLLRLHDGGGALGAVLTRLAEYLDWSRALALWGLPVLLALGWLAWRVPLPAPASTPAPTGEQRLLPCPAPGCSSPALASSTAATASSWPGWPRPTWRRAGAPSKGASWWPGRLAQTASGLGLPLLAAGRLDRRPWMALAIAMQLAGFGGLWLAPRPPPALVLAVRRRAWGSFSSSW